MKNPGGKSIYFPDTWIFFIAIPFISAFNYYLTYSNIQFNGFLVLTFTIDTFQGYIAWLLVRELIVYLDRRVPYLPNLLKRISLQLLLTTLAALTFIALTTEMVSWIAKGKSAPASFYTMDLLIISIWFLVINGVYIGIYFYRQWQIAEATKKNAKGDLAGLIVRKGNQNLLVKFENISLFTVDSEYVQLLDSQGKKYLVDLSLDKIEKKVPAETFFRLNRQVIANRRVINGFGRLEGGKLLVQLTIPSDSSHDLTVSRTKAPAFRGWFLPE